MNEGHDNPSWVQNWDGDWRELVPRINEIGNHGATADYLFASKQEAFNLGVAVGSTRRDLELRGLEAVTADEDAIRVELLRWLDEMRLVGGSRGQPPIEPPGQRS